MYRLINKHCDAVLTEIQRKNGLPGYQELQRLLPMVDVSADYGFQRKYRNYWRMNVARLGDPFYSRYFVLLEELKRSATDIGRVVRRLSIVSSPAERQSMQFSFASKLVHTLDAREPVYDSLVASFYFFAPGSSSLAFDERLERLLKFHDFLRSEYQRVIEAGLLDLAIGRFRERFKVDDTLCNERIVDLLIWGFVVLLRGGIQGKGQCLYA